MVVDLVQPYDRPDMQSYDRFETTINRPDTSCVITTLLIVDYTYFVLIFSSREEKIPEILWYIVVVEI